MDEEVRRCRITRNVRDCRECLRYGDGGHRYANARCPYGMPRREHEADDTGDSDAEAAS